MAEEDAPPESGFELEKPVGQSSEAVAVPNSPLTRWAEFLEPGEQPLVVSELPIVRFRTKVQQQKYQQGTEAYALWDASGGLAGGPSATRTKRVTIDKRIDAVILTDARLRLVARRAKAIGPYDMKIGRSQLPQTVLVSAAPLRELMQQSREALAQIETNKAAALEQARAATNPLARAAGAVQARGQATVDKLAAKSSLGVAPMMPVLAGVRVKGHIFPPAVGVGAWLRGILILPVFVPFFGVVYLLLVSVVAGIGQLLEAGIVHAGFQRWTGLSIEYKPAAVAIGGESRWTKAKPQRFELKLSDNDEQRQLAELLDHRAQEIAQLIATP